MRHTVSLLIGLIAVVHQVASADEAFPAHRVAGNLYYVGSRDLASYLLTTKDGHFLINSGFEETVPLIRTAVESLGYKLTDVKYLLASHAHNDHVAGMALLQEVTGADVLIMEGDDAVIAEGGVGQYLYTDHRWEPCPVARVLKDDEGITLGGVTLTARKTPGHTRGCTTWRCEIKDGDRKLNAVIIGSPNVNPGYQLVNNKDYPTIADDYARTFKVLKELPCDLFLGAHGEYYGMIAKYEKAKSLKPGDANPFIDPDGYRDYIDLKEKTFRRLLAEQQAKK